MTNKLKLESSHEVIETVNVADVDNIFQGKPTDPDILTVVMKDGTRLYCDEVCPVDSLQEEPVSAKNPWKDAHGDDLPEIDREVIAIKGIVDPTATDCFCGYEVIFAHRPSEHWDGKNIDTGKVTRYYPKTYGKGGWNIPNVVYWLDVELPKEIEL